MGFLAVLQEIGALCGLISSLSLLRLVLLIAVLILVFPIVDILSSSAILCSLWRCKVRVRVVAVLP